MARVRTLLEMRTEVRQRADMVNSQFVSDAEIDRYLNESISELYDIIIETAAQEYYLATHSFNTVANQDTYLLPADMYVLKGVDAQVGAPAPLPIMPYRFNDRYDWRNVPGFWSQYGEIQYRLLGHAHSVPTDPGSPLFPAEPTGLLLNTVDAAFAATASMQNNDVSMFYIGQTVVFGLTRLVLQVLEVREDLTPQVVVFSAPLIGVVAGETINQVQVADYAPQIRFTPIPTAATSINIWYIPHAPVLATDEDLWNGFNGWEEYPIVDSAIKCLEKEESDTSALELRKQRLYTRIQSLSQKRDGGFPESVTDVYQNYSGYWRW